MTEALEKIGFAHIGIGHALAHDRLVVPLNQREYSWKKEHVQELFQDFQRAIAKSKSAYFLGTIVLTKNKTKAVEVADGQQRLATTTVLLAAIRNYLFNAGAVGRASTIENEYLLKTDLRSKDVVPSDAVFEVAFAEARVSKSPLARYYLRTLERQASGSNEPEAIVNDNEQEINLEHVLPENPGVNWPDVTPETASVWFRRVGNMVLMPATVNSIIGNSSFNEKRPILAQSGLKLTAEVANQPEWNDVSIADRQKELAKLAVKAWPIEVK